MLVLIKYGIMDDHFYAGEQSSGLQRLGIENRDIEALRPGGWLTDTCIREVVARFGNFKTSRVNIVDPNWVEEWIANNFVVPQDTPNFFMPKQGVGSLQGLAIPIHQEGNHWAALYVDLELCGAIYFNTRPGLDREQFARALILRFYTAFRERFQGQGVNQFRFFIDHQTPDQADIESCGIYAAAAVIDLLSMARPRTDPLTREQIRIFRENATMWLMEAPKSWDFFNRDKP